MDEPSISDRVLIRGTLTPLTLWPDGRLRWSEKDRQRCLWLEKEGLGFFTDGPKIKIRVVAESRDGNCFLGSGGAPLARKQFVFETLFEDSKEVWCQKLRHYFDSLDRPKKLLIFINPFGGRKSARKIFMGDVQPLLEDAEIEFTVQETTHQLHAKEIVGSMDLSKYDGVVCVSGDGVLVEVVNGLLERNDWETAIKMPIGIIPAGTGNGMIKSLLDSVGDSCTVFRATLAVIRGHKQSLDVATLSQGQTRFFSVLMLAWGLVADIDIESEKYRWMGSARLDIYALERIIHLRKYNGRVSFVPAPGFGSFGEPSNQQGGLADGQNTCNISEENPVKTYQCGYRGPSDGIENMEWRTLNGPFVSIWLHNVPWGSEDTLAAPDAKFSDGYLDLIIIRDCPRLSLLRLVMKLNNGDHVKSPYVMYLKVKAFALEPGMRSEEPAVGGIIDVDGEVLARGEDTDKLDKRTVMDYDKLQITVDKGLATLFSPM